MTTTIARTRTGLLCIMLLWVVPGASQDAVDRAGARPTIADILEAADLHEGTVKCGLPAISRALEARDLSKQSVLEALLARPSMDVSRVAGPFRIHYDTSGSDAPAILDAQGRRIAGTAEEFIDSALSILSYVSALETQTLGYLEPPSDAGLGDGPQYDIYVMELGAVYGYTTPDVGIVPGDTVTSYISIDNDFIFVSPAANKGLPALRVTMAHELHHAIQLGRYGYWTADVFWYEMTATWLEDVAYTTVNDYYNYLYAAWGHFRNPQVEFSASSLIMYSRAIWNHFLAAKHGPDVVRRSWEFCRQYRPLEAMDRALRERGAGLATMFSEWSLWNYFTGARASMGSYYPEGAAYPLVSQTRITFVPPARDLADSLRSLSARYFEVYSGADTATLIAANTDLSGAQSGASRFSSYLFSLASSDLDGTYTRANASLFVQFRPSDPGRWGSWIIGDSTIQSGTVAKVPDGTPFPNPFRPAAQREVYIPVPAQTSVSATLSLFTTSMERVAHSTQVTREQAGRQVVSWDGLSERGGEVPSGVYIFVLSIPDRTMTGKVAVIRP